MRKLGMAKSRCASGLLLLAAGYASAGCVGKIGDGPPGTNPSGAGSVTPNYAMVRLTNAQYLNTLQDLFPNVSLPSITLPNENVIDGFMNAASGQTVTSLLVSEYQSAAEAIAATLAASPTTFLSCQPTTTAD